MRVPVQMEKHNIMLIDRPEELESKLFPFIDAHDQLGFDAEWDQSHIGRIGT